MENQKQPQKRALIMSEEEWARNKAWIKQFPGTYCIPIIEQFEKYLRVLPSPPSDPTPLVSEENKVSIEPNESSKDQNQQ